jgi:deoxyribodipyrimidine photo-lyase
LKLDNSITIFWHRRDLRLEDNAGLYHALKGENPVLSLFIFDSTILSRLEDKTDARVSFIHQEVQRLAQELEALGSCLLVRYGKPEEVWAQLLEEYNIQGIFTNKDYESYAKARDSSIQSLLQHKGIPFHSYKDQVIFEELEITKKDGLPYTVFTPYSRKWKEKLQSKMMGSDLFYLKSYPNQLHQQNYLQQPPSSIPTLSEMSFEASTIAIPSKVVAQGIIKNYDKNRDYPALDATSRLGIHFRFGTISIRVKARKALALNETFLNELIWRDFYAQILVNFPKVENYAFRKEYDLIEWRNDEAEFKAWCEGRTGYPIVDAGMRELNVSGHMHNRVRMVVASFLTKHLLIDWRWGEAYFAQKLLDFDLASNNGGWQWAAGSGTDAAPYFRIFNPTAQQEKFDKEFKYIKKWVKEYGTNAYPKPIVDHKMARERCLEVYKAGLADK